MTTPSRHHYLGSLLLVVLLLSGPLLLAQEPVRTVQVGIFDLHPMVYQDEKGNAQGFYVDLLQEIALQENWQLEFSHGTWAEGLEKVRGGSLDLMTVIIPTPERDAVLDFCQEEVMLVWGQVFAPRDATIQNILDLEGANVAIMRDDLNGQNFRTMAANFGVTCRITLAESHTEVFEMVQSGQVVAGVAPNIFGFPHAHEYGLKQTSVIFSPSSTTLATTEGMNADLLEAIDRYLNQWKAEHGSFYYQSLDRWFTSTSSAGNTFPRWLAWTLMLAAFVTVLLVQWNRILNSRVIARTRQLKDSETKIRAIFDHSFIFIGLLNLEGRLVEINRTAVEFAGVKSDDVLGKYFWDGPWWNYDPALQEEVKMGVAKALAGATHFGEAIHYDSEGVPHTLEYSIKPVFDDDGKVIMLIPEGQDVSERKRLASDLRQSQKMEAIGTLAGGIAHDFNNILTAIAGFNDLAREDAKGQPLIEESLQEVALASDRARDLVQQILTFSRRRESQKSVFTPAVVIQEAAKLLRSSFPAFIAMETHVVATGRVLADPTQIHQVLMNLGTNAYHAMEAAGGTLTIRLTDVELDREMEAMGSIIPGGQYVQLEVSDDGIGMDLAEVEKIFEPYFTSKESGKGTGLGLSVVHGIVQSSQGHLQVKSEPGKGTQFLVYFPLTQKTETPAETLPENSIPIQGQERILFVDDEIKLTSLASQTFGALGYDLQAFSDGPSAWEAFRADPDSFDLVITDQAMPQMSGLELVGNIRDLRKDLPAIICTGYNSGITPADIHQLNIQKLVNKPLLMRSLAGEVRKVLDR